MIAAFARASAASRGILLYLLALSFFALQDVAAKHLAQDYAAFMVVWARYSAQTFWTLLILSPWLRRYLRTEHLWLQLIRSACLFTSTACIFTGFKYLKFAEAVAIFEITPLVITALSVVILKEQVGIRRWIGVSLGLVGALIIIRPGSDVFTWYALFPVGSALAFAAYSIATRFLSSNEPPVTSFIYSSLIGTIAASILLPGFWTTPAPEDVPLLSTFGMLGGIGHYILIAALTLAPASVLAPFSYIALLYSALFGFLIFDEVPDAYTWLGAAIIVGAGLYVWYRENRAKRAGPDGP